MTAIADDATEADVGAIIACIALKMAVELGAEVAAVEGAAAIRYREPLFHPWPRAVELHVDIMARDLDSGLQARAAMLADRDEVHRLSIFGWDVTADAEAIAAAGYDGCWNTDLLAADLATAPARAADGLAIERVEREDQIAELNALAPDFASYPASLGRPEFIDLLGRRAGRAVAKGQIVCAAGGAAYVADMFTEPAARNTGCAGALLSALHGEAAARGVRRTVLIPSLEAAQSGFYGRRGYRTVCARALLLSKG